MAEATEETFKSMVRWLALNVGVKYPILSTVGVIIIAALVWNWYFRSVSPEETKAPTTINNNKTTGTNSPIMPDNKGTVTIGAAPPDKPKEPPPLK